MVTNCHQLNYPLTLVTPVKVCYNQVISRATKGSKYFYKEGENEIRWRYAASIKPHHITCANR